MDRFEKNINVRYLQNAASLLQELKELTYELLDIPTCAHILDAGCGPGIDTVAIVKLAPAGCEVIGIDSSEEMVRAADERAKKELPAGRVRHLIGSVARLPFDDASFDAVRAERLFQVIAETVIPSRAIFAELFRVLKNGGRMVLADTDWATASVDFSYLEVERALIRFFSDRCRPSGYAARTFARVMKEAGMRDVRTFVFPVVMTTFDEENPLADWLYREAKEAGVVSPAQLELWMSELKDKSAKGTFFSVTNMNVVAGVK